MRRLFRVVLALCAAVIAVSGLSVQPAGAAPISIVRGTTPVYGRDAPDPFVVKHGSTYWAYTTGTSWGNHIGILKSTSPAAGFRTYTGQSYGSSAFPQVHWTTAPAAWQVPGTQVAPGVLFRGGRWILYYAAQSKVSREWCLSIATASSPRGPFADRTGNKPWHCMDAQGGAVDPSPYVGTNGGVWLHFKTNTGTRVMSARLWAMELNAEGTRPKSEPRVVLTQNSVNYPWETTVENPHMVVRNGVRYLFYSGNRWDSSRYAQSYAICSTVSTGCRRVRSTPVLASYGNVKGPGGGAAFSNGSGTWWLAFHAWGPSCSSYACGGTRKLYVQRLSFG